MKRCIRKSNELSNLVVSSLRETKQSNALVGTVDAEQHMINSTDLIRETFPLHMLSLIFKYFH